MAAIRKRTGYIGIRLTQAEHNALREQAAIAHDQPSVYVRKLLLRDLGL